MEPKIQGNRWEKGFEEDILRRWKQQWPYAFDAKSRKPVYSIDTPPPYVNTPVHIGQATTYVLMDMFARFRRMTGFNVLFPLGLDRNGLPIEMAAEKKFGLKLTDVRREKAMEMCRSILEESSLASVESFFRLGISFNSWCKGSGVGDLYETDSDDYRSLTQDTFIDLWNKGLIYEDDRLNNYCPGCQTTLADAEIDRKDAETFLNYVRFKVKETGKEILIATTRPELLCTAALVIFNPKDKRYAALEGKTAVVPVFGMGVRIEPDSEADPKFGTGLVFMSASAGDQDAVRFLRKKSIKPVQAVGTDGRMLDIAGPLKGMRTKDARANIIELIRESGALDRQERFMHSVPICERSGDEIEYISMPEFYVKQVEFKAEMKRLARKMDFFSPKSRQMLLDWIESVSIDWPVSRRRFYATEVPVWYCTKCGSVIIPQKGGYHRPWKEEPPIGSSGLKKGARECTKCGSGQFRGDERVFDTWFDSSISPLYILKYTRSPEGFFDTNKPCSLRPQGKEIIRTWLYYTVLKDWLLTGECIFKDVWINYHILDEKGRKMSKRLGNSIDPKDVLDKFGAEPFRLWAAIEGNLENTDFHCSFERMEGASKTLTKLWNVARLISMFPSPAAKPGKLCPLDEWILAEADGLVRLAKERYEQYDFHNPAVMIKNFIWEAFASHYVELVKQRAYNQEGRFTKEEEEAARHTLHAVLDKVLLLLAPVTPFITHALYKDLRGRCIHAEEFPDPGAAPRKKPGFGTEDIAAFNSAVWKAKKDKGLSLKSEVASAVIPKNLKPIEKDMLAAHGIKKHEFGDVISVVLSEPPKA